MSGSPASGATGLPAVNQALEPAWVRSGSQATKQEYATALRFESMLVEELTKSLAASAGLGGESAEEGASSGGGAPGEGTSGEAAAGAGALSSLLPQSLASSVTGAGGLGLAAQLTRSAQALHPAPGARPTGGTAA